MFDEEPTRGVLEFERCADVRRSAGRYTHTSPPDTLARPVADNARAIGADGVVTYLIGYEQHELIPVPSEAAASVDVLRVDGTVAGRTFVNSTILDVEAGHPDRRRLWLPFMDGTELRLRHQRVGGPPGCVRRHGPRPEHISDKRYGAGHVPPLLVRRGRLIKTLETPASTPLGVPFGEQPVALGQVWLEPGDRVLLHTDGVIEARDNSGEFFTAERLAEF